MLLCNHEPGTVTGRSTLDAVFAAVSADRGCACTDTFAAALRFISAAVWDAAASPVWHTSPGEAEAAADTCFDASQEQPVPVCEPGEEVASAAEASLIPALATGLLRVAATGRTLAEASACEAAPTVHVAAGVEGDDDWLPISVMDRLRALAAAGWCSGLPALAGLVTDWEGEADGDGESEGEGDEVICDWLLRSCFLLAMSSCSCTGEARSSKLQSLSLS